MEPIGAPIEYGIIALSALGFIFIALKLCGAVGWGWWWVMAPFLLQAAVLLVALLALVVVTIIGLRA